MLSKAIQKWGPTFKWNALTQQKCADRHCRAGSQFWRVLFKKHYGIRAKGNWYCGPECFERAAEQECQTLVSTATRPRATSHRMPLGLLMVSRGIVEHEHVKTALEAQRSNGGGKLGEWLQKMGMVTEHQVTMALGAQWSCPIFTLNGNHSVSADLIPFRLLELHKMLPVHYVQSRSVLYLAFSQGIDYGALYAIERMLGCHTEPCLVPESVLNRELERLRERSSKSAVVFECSQSSFEMARIVTGYALQMRADEARFVLCGDYIWVRLERDKNIITILFRALGNPPSSAGESRIMVPATAPV